MGHNGHFVITNTLWMLVRKALNISWKSRTTNEELHGDSLPISEKFRIRRLRFARHCARSKSEDIRSFQGCSQRGAWAPSVRSPTPLHPLPNEMTLWTRGLWRAAILNTPPLSPPPPMGKDQRPTQGLPYTKLLLTYRWRPTGHGELHEG